MHVELMASRDCCICSTFLARAAVPSRSAWVCRMLASASNPARSASLIFASVMLAGIRRAAMANSSESLMAHATICAGHRVARLRDPEVHPLANRVRFWRRDLSSVRQLVILYPVASEVIGARGRARGGVRCRRLSCRAGGYRGVLGRGCAGREAGGNDEESATE